MSRKPSIPYEQRIGEKHNMLTILKITGKEHSGKRVKIRCLVQCECGNEKDVRIEGVVNGQQFSCGCKRKRFHNSAIRKNYNNYKNSAKDRGYYFNLTEKEFEEISSQNCHYCGSVPNREVIIGHDTFVINGIDRKDNTKGYDVENSLPCCSICNRAKSTMTYDDFISYLRRAGIWQNNLQKV